MDDHYCRRHAFLQEEMSRDLTHTEYAKLNKELSQLRDVATLAVELEEVQKEIVDVNDVIKEEMQSTNVRCIMNKPIQRLMYILYKGRLEGFIRNG